MQARFNGRKSVDWCLSVLTFLWRVFSNTLRPRTHRAHWQVLVLRLVPWRLQLPLFCMCMVRYSSVCLLDRSLSDASLFAIFTSAGIRPNVQKQFPMCPTVVLGKMTQHDHLISNSQSKLSANTYKGLFQCSFPDSAPDKTAVVAVGPGEKRPRWKITAEINKAIFCRVSGWRSGYLLWGGARMG